MDHLFRLEVTHDRQIVFTNCAGRETEVEADLENSQLTIRCADSEETLPFSISDFDRELVNAGGWLEFADARY